MVTALYRTKKPCQDGVIQASMKPTKQPVPSNNQTPHSRKNNLWRADRQDSHTERRMRHSRHQ